MFEVTMKFPTQAALLAFFAGQPQAVEAPAPIAEAPKAVKPPKLQAAAPAPTPTAPVAPAVVSTETATESPFEPAPAVSYQQVADLVVKYSRIHGRPATVAKLEPHGISALPAAKPEQFAAILSTFEAALA